MQPVNRMSLKWERGRGAQDKIISERLSDEVMLAFHTKKDGRGWSSCKPDTLLSLCTKNNGLYEVLHTYPKKVYFDIDFKDPEDGFNSTEFLKDTLTHIRLWLPDMDVAVSGNVSPEKASFHLVAQNYIVSNDQELLRMKHMAKGMSLRVPSLDWTVYTKNRQMKLPNQSKPNKPVQAILDDYPLNCHVIQAFFTGKERTLPNELPEDASIDTDTTSNYTTKSFEMAQDLPVPNGIEWEALLHDPEQILALIPNGPQFSHAHTSRVGNFCYWANLPKSTFLKWLSQKDPLNTERLHKYNTYHWERYKDFPEFKVSTYRMRSFLPNWYPNLMPKDKELNDFQRNWLPDPITYISTLEPAHVDADYKYIVFTNPMGKGKTTMLIEYMKQNPNLKYVWVAPRITLVDDTVQRMSELKVTHYGKLGSAQNKHHRLKFHTLSPNPIVCLNSLHLLWERDVFPDVLILDELETMLTTLCGDFIQQKDVLFRTLQKMIQHASKVICLDAFITQRTTRFLQNLAQMPMIVYDTPAPPEPTRTVVELTCKKEKVLERMVRSMCEGKRLICFYPYKKGNAKHQTMDAFVQSLYVSCTEHGLDCAPDQFIGYHGDTDPHLKKHIQDVNTHWTTKRFVCFNNVITAGVSYTAQSFAFDDCYLFVAPFNDPRDIAQASYRARQITSNTIYLKWLSGYKPDVMSNDRMGMPEAYNALYQDTVIEKRCPNKHALMMFFHRAHYAVQEPMSRIVQEDCAEYFTSPVVDNIYAWDSIPSIDKGNFKEIVQRTFTGDINLKDKMMAQKYVFCCMFKPDTPTEFLATAWDEHKRLLQPLFEAIHNEDSFEMHLARDNEWEFFPYIEEPTRSWDVKISPEVKEKIFAEWTSLRVSGDPQVKQLLKSVYNHKYGRDTIVCEPDKKKHFYYSTPCVQELQDVKEMVKEYYQGNGV